MHQIKRSVVLLLPAVVGMSCLHERAAMAQTVKVDEGEPKATAIGYRYISTGRSVAIVVISKAVPHDAFPEIWGHPNGQSARR